MTKSISDGSDMGLPETRVTKRLMALKNMSMDQLREEWRRLFETEAPGFNRKSLEAKLAYRIQELSLGGLKPATREYLEAIGNELDGGSSTVRKRKQPFDLVVGTRLVREWQGEEFFVTVTHDGFELRGKPFRSLSAVARSITGTRWNGWVFFGLKRQGATHV